LFQRQPGEREVAMDKNARKAAKRIAERYEGANTADYTCDGCKTRVVSMTLPAGWEEHGKQHYCPNCESPAAAPTEDKGLVSILIGMRRGRQHADADFLDWLEYDGGYPASGKLKELGDLLAANTDLAVWYIQKADKDEDKPFESDLVRGSSFKITGDMVRSLPDDFVVNNMVIPLFYGGHDRGTKDGWQAVFARMNPVAALVSGYLVHEDDIDDYTPDDIANGFGVDRITAEKWIEDAKRSGVKQGQPMPTYRP